MYMTAVDQCSHSDLRRRSFTGLALPLKEKHMALEALDKSGVFKKTVAP